MEKYNKAELISIIEEQDIKLNRYKSRLSDTVRAYKGLLSEKEALESSLKVLTSDQSSRNETEREKNSASADQNSSKAESSDAIQSNEEYFNDLHHQIKTLSTSLATLTAEKSRIEASFIADRKSLMQEKVEISEKLDKQRLDFCEEKEQLNKQIQQLKLRIRELQQDREREQRDHAVMLRELQHLLSEERNRKEQLELKLEDAERLAEKSKTTDKRIEEYEKRIIELKHHLSELNDRLKASEIKVNEPSPILIELRQEMADLKTQHNRAVEQEQKRANEAEDKLRNLAVVSEERIANLEARLSELSQMVGNYDRLQQQDQTAIQKLKERIMQLDSEKVALTRTIAGEIENSLETDDDSNLDVQTLMKKIIKLKKLLKVANQRSERPIDLGAFFSQDDGNQIDLHVKCQEELQQLKEEFENYKLRAQSAVKNKNSKDNEYAKEVQLLNNQNLDLQEKVQMLRFQLENMEKQCKNKEESFQVTIQEMRELHKQNMMEMNTEYKSRLNDVENHLKKQRERTLLLLEEKDNEIKLLKLQNPLISIENKMIRTKISQNNQESNKEDEFASELDSLTSMLSHSVHSGKSEGHLLHYAHELARKDVEITNLRSAKHQAESALRELQQVTLTKEEKYMDEIVSLNSKIQRLESNQTSEGMNMEYLKNVVLRYITCKDGISRHHMLNAIATVLHFTPHEIEQVKLFNQSWRWNNSK
ncbi:GRIP and coiled-coil domain-containing protein 1-like [Centruroides sculpturatus]|uniref:GRIP and coiled-coil domain-containing protein 1-like n=1 Tax=Centruroides sculpturatus TaxID=218467 RepID=UPI000C6D60A4|nr:GRIP and coiled-coil domain-containing protein 1-like [Centruroides sculpturatus]